MALVCRVVGMNASMVSMFRRFKVISALSRGYVRTSNL